MESLTFVEGGIVLNDHPAVTGTEVICFGHDRKFKWSAVIWTGLNDFPGAKRSEKYGSYEANSAIVPMEIGDFVMYGRPLSGGGSSWYLFEITGAETLYPLRDEPKKPFLREAFVARGWDKEYLAADLELPWFMK